MRTLNPVHPGRFLRTGIIEGVVRSFADSRAFTYYTAGLGWRAAGSGSFDPGGRPIVAAAAFQGARAG